MTINKLFERARWLSAAALLLMGNAHADTIDLPHAFQRINPNLVSNPSFATSADWTFEFSPSPWSPSYHQPIIDNTVSRTLGSGSLKFQHQTDGEQPYTMVYSKMITGITPDTYTIAYYVKSPTVPLYLNAMLKFYDAGDNELGTSYTTGIGTASVANEWQEVTSIVTVANPAVVKVKVLIYEDESPSYDFDYYIDDVYFGKGMSFAESPSNTRQPWPRTSSNANVKVDELGNWRVYEKDEHDNYVWEDFFPFGLYVTQLETRTSYQPFSDQGFNLTLNQQFASQIQRAKDAVSDFNPNGMRAGLRLALYATPPQPYWTLSLLEDIIESIYTAGLEDTLLCYDWDNENNWKNWSHWQSMVATIRNNDPDHPIYMLNGQPAAQRALSELSDVSGTYVGVDPASNAENTIGRFEVLQNLEKQTVPVSIAQINEVENTLYGFRMRVYDALIKGARGIVWFGDDNQLENTAYWDDIPVLREELDQLLPLLKQPHWTTWSASSSDTNVRFNTRNLNGEGYLIAMNPQSTDSLVTFTLTGITPSEVWNYFNDDFVTLVVGGTFTVKLPAHGTAVYRLSNNTYAEALANGAMEVAGSPLNQWSTFGSATWTRDTTVKYNGAASARIDNASTSSFSQYYQFFGALQPNTRYRFSTMVKTDNVVKGNPSAAYDGAIIQLYTGGLNQFWPLPGLAGSHDWQLIQEEFITPATPNTTWYIRLQLGNASGSVWFDNVSLKELP